MEILDTRCFSTEIKLKYKSAEEFTLEQDEGQILRVRS